MKESDYWRSFWPLSMREQDQPGTIIRCTGEMDVCEGCGQRFRRMSEKRICGVCYPRPLVDVAESA